MFSSSESAPAGYITMTAGDIAAAAKVFLRDVRAKQAAWDAALPGILTNWRGTQSRLLFWIPRDPVKLVRWYLDFTRTHERPTIKGLDSWPGTPGWLLDWYCRTAELSADTKVFINVDDGSALTPWIPKP